MTTECVIFDCDGTLFDTGEGIRDCARKSLAAVGAPDADEQTLNAFIGPSLFYSFTVTVGLSEELALKAVDYYRQIYPDDGLFKCYPYDGVEQMLASLSANGYTLAVASSKPLTMVDRLLRRYGYDKYFAAVSAPDFHKRGSSKRELILDACLGGFNIMVGDTCYDVDGAHDAGIKAVAVTYGYGSEQTLASADYFASSPQEVLNVLSRIREENRRQP